MKKYLYLLPATIIIIASHVQIIMGAIEFQHDHEIWDFWPPTTVIVALFWITISIIGITKFLDN